MTALQSDTLAALLPALVAAQAELRTVHKGERNPQTGSTYADLTSVLDMTRPVLAAQQLVMVQAPLTTPDGIVLVSTLYHASGEWLRSVTPVNPRVTVKGGAVMERDDMQNVGAAITYARRYALVSMLGIGQRDDDGNMPQGAPSGAANANPNAANVTQRGLLAKHLRAAGFDLNDDAGKADARAFVSYALQADIASLRDVTKRQVSAFLKAFGGSDPDEAALAKAVSDWRGPS